MKEYGSAFELSYTQGKGNGYIIEDSSYAIYLRSAREALYVIGKQELTKGINTIYMPALCCASMVQPFIQIGYEIIYYKISEAMSIDVDYLQSIIKDNSLILVMNYHGIQGFNIKEIKEIINFRNIKIIQDCTQHIFSQLLYKDVDYQVGSIRKWLPIPDGAFLFGEHINTKTDVIKSCENDVFVQMSYAAMVEKTQYLKNGNQEIKACYRKKNTFCMEYLRRTITPTLMSKLAKEIICNDIDKHSVMKIRKENYDILFKKIKEKHLELLKYTTPQDCPLCLSIYVDNRDDIQRQLAERGVFCQVLWPLPPKASMTCSFSRNYTEHMLAIPCDQRYNISDMECIADRLDEVLCK